MHIFDPTTLVGIHSLLSLAALLSGRDTNTLRRA